MVVVAKRGACVAAFTAHLSHYRLLCGRRSDRTRTPATSACSRAGNVTESDGRHARCWIQHASGSKRHLRRVRAELSADAFELEVAFR